MKEINNLKVLYKNRMVGTLAETNNKQIAFQYDTEWINNGFSVSPFSLPLDNRVFLSKNMDFDGLFGVFSDSLPDGWGRLLVDRFLQTKGYSISTVTPLLRLGIVGSTGMGALEYHPELIENPQIKKTDFDLLAQECEKILQEQQSDDLDTLFALGGSSGGARPKVLITLDGESWIVKFPSSYDTKKIGEEEYTYMKCAASCGIDVPAVTLFPSKKGSGYFGVKRFDRVNNEKIHMVTASGLLETTHRIPNLDYCDLMKLTYLLTKDMKQVEELYRRMCFNVFAHNRDDHSKNFTFQYIENEKRWIISPVYDLTYSNSLNGEHATCINGNGKNPGIKELIEVGVLAGLSEKNAKTIASEIQEIVMVELSELMKRHE